MQHSQRADAEATGSNSGTATALARPLNPLLPLAAAGGFALAGLALSWQQSQATLSMASRATQNQAILAALAAVESGVLRGTLHVSLLRQSQLDTAATLGFSPALTDRPLAELERLTADDSAQQAHVAKLRSYLLAHRRSRESFSDQQLQTTLAQLTHMTGVERHWLAQRSATLARLQRNLRLLEATSGLAILLLVGVAAWMLLRERRFFASAQGELVRSEERFRYLFENSGLGIAITRLGAGGAGQALQVNGALAHLLGTTRAAIEERGLLAYRLDPGPQPEDKDFEAMLEGTLPSLRQTRAYRHANGDTVWVDETSFVRPGGSGNQRRSSACC